MSLANINAQQWVTLVFGVSVIVTGIVWYNNPAMNQSLSNFLDALGLSLGFLFAALAILASNDTNPRSANMYKWFILLVALAAWIIVIISTSATGWQNVQDHVAQPIAYGSALAVPLALFTFTTA